MVKNVRRYFPRSTTVPSDKGAFSFSEPTLSLCLDSHPACVWSLAAAIIIPNFGAANLRGDNLPERMLFLRTYAYLAEPMLLEAKIFRNVCCFMAGTRLCAVTQNEHNAFWQGAHQCVARASSPSHPFPHCCSKILLSACCFIAGTRLNDAAGVSVFVLLY
jgi:hypothetical protein